MEHLGTENSDLRPSGYQLDMNTGTMGRGRIALSPFVTYFSNYIFGTYGQWSLLPHAGAVYVFRQSKALITGEVAAEYDLDLAGGGGSRYVYNRNG